MGTNIKLHNPELAANSKFSNLVIESLNTDPIVSGIKNVGRIWFNNTDKTFKATFLNATGDNLEVKTIGDSSQLEIIMNSLTQEISDRESADTTLQSNLDTFSTELTTEITDRTDADNNLGTRIDNVNIAVGITDDLYMANENANFISTATSLVDADNKLDTALKVEKTARIEADDLLDARVTSVESQINGDIGDLSVLTTDEKSTIVGAINELESNTNTNTDNLLNEITDRESADTTLQSNIDTLETTVTTNYLNKTTSTEQIVNANTNFQQNVVINGDLIVRGSSTTVETEILKIADNIITLNNGIGTTTTPTENAGLEIDRGIEGVTTFLQWNETLQQVEVPENGVLRKVATTDYIDGQVSTINSSTTDIQAELDATQVGVGLETNGNYTTNENTNFISTATSLVDADNKLDTALKSEKTARIEADDLLDARVTSVESQINGDIGDLSVLTTDEKSTIVGAINELESNTNTNANNLLNEITDRTTAISTIQTELDATQTGSGLGTDGSYTPNTLSNYLSLATSLVDADNKLDIQTKINADEINVIDTRLTNVEGQVSGHIGNLSVLTTVEKGTIVGAINEVDANIDAEVTRATSAEATLTTNLDAEISDRINVDNNLGARIDNVNTSIGIVGDLYTANETTNFISTATSLVDANNKLDTALKAYQDKIASTVSTTDGTNIIGYEGYTETDTNIVNPTIEIAAGTLTTAISDIASSVNTRINEFENRFVKGEVAATDKSDTYTIAHNLDTEFVDVSIQVYDEDETVWRFDLVVIEVIDVNTVKISLASGNASQIRYVIKGY